MDTWTTQSGYPLITIQRNYTTNTAIINQTKMNEDNAVMDTLWYVPVTYITKENHSLNVKWLENVRKTVLDLNHVENTSWILLNIDETGFYRVNYDLNNWQLLSNQLLFKPSEIPLSSRGQLIDDAFQLANIGVLNYTVPFNLVKYLNIKETNYVAWYSALRNLEELRIIITNYEYSGLYDKFLLKLIGPMFDVLGTKEQPYDTQNEKMLRLHVVKLACILRYEKCISWAKQQYSDWMKLENPDESNP